MNLLERIRSWPLVDDWHVSPDGQHVRLGTNVTLNDHVILGNRVILGNCVILGNRVALGNDVSLGYGVILSNGVKLGNGVKLSKGVRLGAGVALGDGITSMALNEQFRAMYAISATKHLFTKWVTPQRMSPNFDGGTQLHYRKGAIIECPEAVVSDQQCGPGLHVMRLGHRPEWYGLCQAGHDLMPLTVEVQSEDICFAGLPTMDAKLRVRRLVVID